MSVNEFAAALEQSATPWPYTKSATNCISPLFTRPCASMTDIPTAAGLERKKTLLWDLVLGPEEGRLQSSVQKTGPGEMRYMLTPERSALQRHLCNTPELRLKACALRSPNNNINNNNNNMAFL